MQRFIYILLAYLFSFSTLEAQENNSLLNDDTISFEIQKDWLSFHTSAFFGKTFFNENIFATNYGFDYSRQLNNKTKLFVGFDIMNADVKPRDLAPRRTKTSASAYIGLQYDLNERLSFAGSVFYDSFFNTLGADIDVMYKFNEDTYFNFYAMFSKTLDDHSFKPSF